MRDRGVTLIETLAVVVLVALATVVLTRGMTASSPQQKAARAFAMFAEFDASARAMARSTGPLRVVADGDRITASNADNDFLIQRQLPSGWKLDMPGWREHEWLYVIDGGGRSEDVMLLLTGQQMSMQVRIDGLLGSVRTEGTP